MQIYALVAATFLSVFGSSITMVAIPWFLLEFTGDVKSTAVVMAIKILPVIILPLYGSRIVDQYSKRTISIVSDLLSCLAMLMIPLFYTIELLNLTLLVCLICSTTVLEQISASTMSAMIPDLLEHTAIKKERINGIVGSIHNFGDLAGPVVGGLIVLQFGVSIALSIDALTFGLSALLFYLFISAAPGVDLDAKKSADTDDISAGFRFIFSHYCIRFIALLSVMVNLLVLPLLVLILPFIAKTQFGSALNLGFLVSVFGAGALIASFAFTLYGAKVDKLVLILLCNLMLLMSFILASFFTDIYSLAVVLFLIGLSVGFFGPLDDTLLQLYTPKLLRGRVFLAYSTLRYASVPLSLVVFGFLLDSVSVKTLFLLMAGSLAGPLIWLLLKRKYFAEQANRLT